MSAIARIALGIAAATALAGTAQAHGGVGWSVTLGAPGFGVYVPAPVVVAPPPVYGPAVVIGAAPSYYAPPPVYYGPARYYARPYYAVRPAPVWVRPGYRPHGYWHYGGGGHRHR